MSFAAIGFWYCFIWTSQVSVRWRLITSVFRPFNFRLLYLTLSGGLRYSLLLCFTCSHSVSPIKSVGVTSYSIKLVVCGSVDATVRLGKSVLDFFQKLETKIRNILFGLTCSMTFMAKHKFFSYDCRVGLTKTIPSRLFFNWTQVFDYARSTAQLTERTLGLTSLVSTMHYWSAFSSGASWARADALKTMGTVVASSFAT